MFKPSAARAVCLATLFTFLAAFASVTATAQQASAATEVKSAEAAPASDVRAKLEAIFQGTRWARGANAVAVSPDGRFVEWIEGTSSIRIIARGTDGELGLTKDDKGHTIDAGEGCSASDVIWSPDSKRLAYFAACDKKDQQNLFIADVEGDAKPRQITDLKGYVDAPAFSPDGKSIAFLYVEGATRPSGALAAMKPFSGVIGEDGIEIQRVAVANVDVDKPAAPSPSPRPKKLHVYEFDWSSRTAKALAFIAAEPPGEKTTGGLPSCYTHRIDSQTKDAGQPIRRSRPRRSLRSAPRPCKLPSTLVSRRQSHRLHRWPHERPGSDRRRRLDCLLNRRRQPRRPHREPPHRHPPGSSGTATTTSMSARSRGRATSSTCRLAHAAQGLRSGQEVSADCGGAWRPGCGCRCALGRAAD
jgi:hypothetical protein